MNIIPRCFSIVAAVACASGGYDAEYDCAESEACCLELGEAVESTLECAPLAQGLYDSFDDEAQSILDEIFEECSSFTGCEFIAKFLND